MSLINSLITRIGVPLSLTVGCATGTTSAQIEAATVYIPPQGAPEPSAEEKGELISYYHYLAGDTLHCGSDSLAYAMQQLSRNFRNMDPVQDGKLTAEEVNEYYPTIDWNDLHKSYTDLKTTYRFYRNRHDDCLNIMNATTQRVANVIPKPTSNIIPELNTGELFLGTELFEIHISRATGLTSLVEFNRLHPVRTYRFEKSDSGPFDVDIYVTHYSGRETALRLNLDTLAFSCLPSDYTITVAKTSSCNPARTP